MKLQRTQIQTQKILPTQIQFLNFLKLHREELLQTLALHLEENPFLEDTYADEKLDEQDEQTLSYEDADTYEDQFSIREAGINDRHIHEEKKDIFNSTSRGNTCREDLVEEVRCMNLNPVQFDIACYIINSLDDDGYLRQDLDSVMDHFSFSRQQIVSPTDVEDALTAVQSCDPIGVGARDLRECLSLQVFRKAKKTRADVLAYTILEDHFNLLTERKFADLQQVCECTESEMQAALKVIKTLKARPAFLDSPSTFNTQVASDIDFIITKDNDGNLVASLASSFSGRIRISADSEQLLTTITKEKSKGASNRSRETFLRTKAREAHWFIDSIMQRENSMKQVIDAIIRIQKDYLVSGDKSDLKPMILQNIADMIGLDVSTVSRITSTRCADTPIGKIHLKDLFTTGVQSAEGKTVSNANVKEMLAELIAAEDKSRPYTDDELARLLAERGVKIARRTVLKYREQLHIPVGKIRCLQAA
ncbi:MAG: RNA polymerase factor sigma-54 [Chitinophagales bacterium]